MKTKLLTMLTVLLALFSTSLKAQETTYYWYVGQELPTRIDKENLKEATNEAGWHLIGESVDGFTLTFNNDNLIEFEEKKPYYLIIPEELDALAADGSTFLEGRALLPVPCNIPNHKAYVYHTSVWEVKGIVLKSGVTKYFWYVVQEDPANNSTITSTTGEQGWRLIQQPSSVTKNNPLFDTTDSNEEAIVGTSSTNWYIAFPADKSYRIFDSDHADQITMGNFYEYSRITFKDIEYIVYKGYGSARKWWGYTIYSSEVVEPEPETTYYWYLGTEKLLTDEEVEEKGRKISSASEITNPLILPSDGFVYFYYPKTFGKATLTCSGLPAAGTDVIELREVSLTNYNGWRFPKGNEGSITNINFTEPEYTVSLNHTNVTLTVGESVTLIATITPEGATTESMRWRDSNYNNYNTNIVTVEEGVVTAVAEGSTRILVYVGDCVVAACQVTVEAAVVEPEPEPEPTPDSTPITAIGELSNAKLYHVSQPNHSKGGTAWAVAENGTQMKSNVDLGIEVNTEDNSQLFAFVSNDNGESYYLYHAAAKKFVSRDGTLFERPIDAVQFKDGAYDNTFVAYLGDGRYVNVGGSQQLAIDGWSDADGGNSCVILPAGEFDATEALAMFSYEEPEPITSLDELSNSKAYYVKQPQRDNGTSWAVQIGAEALKSNANLGITSTSKDNRQHFAFLTNNEGGTYYLYHVAEAKFVNKDGSLSATPTDVVCFTEGAYDNTFVMFFDNGHYINVGGDNQMVIDGWSTPDGGNSCTLTPVADFDATAALKLIETLETGVESLVLDAQGSQLIYDLTGRRVENPTKGIYIVGGKKVMY